MFKFGFNCEPDVDGDSESLEINEKEKINDNLNGTTDAWYKSDVLSLESEKILKIKENLKHANMFVSNDYEIGFINVEDVVKNQLSGDIIKAEMNHSDLLSGVYEGGLKIWEGTQDLANYLTCTATEDSTNSSEEQEETERAHLLKSFEKKRVLDLGCGAGILGILALKANATNVHFQDYNRDVLTDVTVPNVILNFEENFESILDRTRFYLGDWNSFTDLTLEDDKYDVILTSETIYNASNYQKLLRLFESRLKPDGVIYLAGKTYYFGVGGGLRIFETELAKTNLKSEVIWKHTDGVSRELLKITLK